MRASKDFWADFLRRFTPPARMLLVCLVTCLAVCGLSAASDAPAVYLSDATFSSALKHQQQWGVFGRDTAAAAATGQLGQPLKIGQQTFAHGLGHHAPGEIVVALDGQFAEFVTLVGVQWQGGQRGSVIFGVEVDGKRVFESSRMSDSDPPQEVRVSVLGARELRLVASDAGDGISSDMANWIEARLVRRPGVPCFGTIVTKLAGEPSVPSGGVGGQFLITNAAGPQVAVMNPAGLVTVAVGQAEEVRFEVPVIGATKPWRILVDVQAGDEGRAEAGLSCGNAEIRQLLEPGKWSEIGLDVPSAEAASSLVVSTRGVTGDPRVQWRRWRCLVEGQEMPIPMNFPPCADVCPPAVLPQLRPAIERTLVEYDWRLQDGIGTARERRTYAEAVTRLFERGDLLLTHLASSGVAINELAAAWEPARRDARQLSGSTDADSPEWQSLWLRLHWLRREIAFRNPLADTGPLVFVKQVPSCFSHQLTQYYGMCARPGGGVFVLESPGRTMRTRQLTDLPQGSCQHLDVSWDGQQILFSHCEVPTDPESRTTHLERHYHIYQVNADGSGLQQLTNDPHDDFAPRYLPNGKLLFLSTRRGGFHRCGGGPCPVYTMATADADGSNPHPISYHETHEWDPVVLNDGRLLYTRWDYVDRHAVYYQQLWTARPDGTGVAAFFGNNTFNPVGTWEGRPIPGSDLVMATAGAHHAMTAGSIVLLDVAKGVDGTTPVTRLTPDVLFPESEFPVQGWHAPAGISAAPVVPVDEQRWPGHCYRSPFPLSADVFLAAYSYDPLLGEPLANKANMFGLYLVDRFGNRELLYRDLNIASLWPMPLRKRPVPPVLPSAVDRTETAQGTFFLQNVYDSWPALPGDADREIAQLRIIQVMLKTTPNANSPRVGFANASPGKQVLGTVPVERDGSAYFRAPAQTPLAFQALDRQGMAVQTMRSLTYLQPGERASCVGCHEHRTDAPGSHGLALAQQREPSQIKPGPDGSKPLSFPLLVQPVLDKHCVACHCRDRADGGVILTGEPAGEFTASYNALAPLVTYSEWKGTPADNAEPLTAPERFGARASKLTQLLLRGHEGVALDAADMERVVTWMDANALFYGSFNPEDQQRQQRGERIAGPAL